MILFRIIISHAYDWQILYNTDWNFPIFQSVSTHRKSLQNISGCDFPQIFLVDNNNSSEFGTLQSWNFIHRKFQDKVIGDRGASLIIMMEYVLLTNFSEDYPTLGFLHNNFQTTPNGEREQWGFLTLSR